MKARLVGNTVQSRARRYAVLFMSVITYEQILIVMTSLQGFAAGNVLHLFHWYIAAPSLVDRPWLVAFSVFFSFSITIEIAYRLAQRTRANFEHESHEQIVSLRDAMILLLSFVLGFTYSMALSRYDLRSGLVVDEANAIRATSLRARMLSEGQQAYILDLLRQYVDSRMQLYEAGLDSRRKEAALNQAKQLQKLLSERSIAIGRQDKSYLFGQFVQSLSETIKVGEQRRAAEENRVPPVIWWLITFILLAAAFTAGYSLHRRFWFGNVVLPLAFAVVISVIADLDSPRSGLIVLGHETTARLQRDLERNQ